MTMRAFRVRRRADQMYVRDDCFRDHIQMLARHFGNVALVSAMVTSCAQELWHTLKLPFIEGLSK